MKIIIAKDYDDMSKKAANIIAAQVILKPASVLGLATGSTPAGTYRRLIEIYRNGDIDFSNIISFNLDEYRGIKDNDNLSYLYYMRTKLFDFINIPSEHIHIPDGSNLDIKNVCREYDKLIQKMGGIDLQLLGIGMDGHIGFNEPGDTLELNTHCAELAESTIEANKRFFKKKEDVPRQAYTVGVKTIMQARKVLLLASGKNKSDIIRHAFCGKITTDIPASLLQMHPDFTLIIDKEASAKIVCNGNYNFEQ